MGLTRPKISDDWRPARNASRSDAGVARRCGWNFMEREAPRLLVVRWIEWLDLETLLLLVILIAPFIVGNFRNVWNFASRADDSLRL